MIPNIAGWIDNLMSIVAKKKYSIVHKSSPTGDRIEGRIDVNFF